MHQTLDASPEAMLREQAYMQAFNNWMLYKQYLQNERTQALLVAILSAQGDASEMIKTAQSMMDQTKGPQADASMLYQ